MTIKRSYVDEWTLIAKDFTNMLVSRHSVAGAWCGGTSNPDGPQHYLKKEYMDVAAQRGHQVFPFELEDNRANLPDGYIENLSAQYTGLWHDRFIKGLWTMADGVVYESFDPALHVVYTLPEMHRILCMGIDYGDTNPTRGILLGLGVDNRLYAMAEWAPGKGTTADRSTSLATFLDAYPTWEFLFVDPAAAGFKFQLNRDQFPNVANAANRVDDGIKVVSSLFTTRQLLIHESCTNLLAELPGYVWDDKQTKKGHDAPVKVDDHAVDALRYAVATSRPFWQPYLPNLDAVTRLPDERIEAAA